VTTGIRASSKIRLFRKIKAPILDEKPVFTGAALISLDCTHHGLQSTSGTSWVRLGLLVEAYNIKCLKGNRIKVSEHHTLLPVHRLWIFLLGILGRYSNRVEDEGKIPSGRPRVATPGSLRYGQRYSSLSGMETRAMSVDSMRRTSRQSVLLRGDSKLYGITGCFEKRDSGAHGFVRHEQAAIGTIPTNVLSLGQLLWFALGAIPIDENNVYSLDDVESKKKQGNIMEKQQTQSIRLISRIPIQTPIMML
jgi:hypothetical protein